MWSTLSLPWQVCWEEAWIACCHGNKPIGAVVTAADGSILSRGRNRMYDKEGGEIRNHILAHAELNALLALDLYALDPRACILYSTTEPCPLCLGAWYMSGMRELRYASRDPNAGCANLLGTTPYMGRKPVRVFGPERRDLDELLLAVHAADALEHGGTRAFPLLDCWEAVIPNGVRFGRSLVETGQLKALREAGCPPAEAIDELEKAYLQCLPDHHEL